MNPENFMKHAVDLGLGTMVTMPRFVKVGSTIQKFTRGIHRHTDIVLIA
jgi:hypothetical protein